MRTLKIHVKPNARARRLVAEHFAVPRTNVSLASGAGSPRTRVRVLDV